MGKARPTAQAPTSGADALIAPARPDDKGEGPPHRDGGAGLRLVHVRAGGGNEQRQLPVSFSRSAASASSEARVPSAGVELDCELDELAGAEFEEDALEL